MQIRVLKSFVDKYTNKVYKVHQKLNMSRERCDEIMNNSKGYIEVINDDRDEKTKN